MYLCSLLSWISVLEGCQPSDPFLMHLKMPIQHVRRHGEGIRGLAVSQPLSLRQGGQAVRCLNIQHGDIKEVTSFLYRAL